MTVQNQLYRDDEDYTLSIFDLTIPGATEQLGNEIVARRGQGTLLYHLDEGVHYALLMPTSKATKEREA